LELTAIHHVNLVVLVTETRVNKVEWCIKSIQKTKQQARDPYKTEVMEGISPRATVYQNPKSLCRKGCTGGTAAACEARRTYTRQDPTIAV